MKKNATKRALVLSMVSLMLCFSMLLGTTYAWFTDSVTSTNNIIKSGNLDVKLQYSVLQADGTWTAYEDVDEDTNVFKEGALWEPGYTEVVRLKVVNAGSLALKYQLGVNVADETSSVTEDGKTILLSDHIMYGIVDGAENYTRETAVAAVAGSATKLKSIYSSKVTSLEPANDSASDEKTVTMVVYMPTTVGNEANAKTGAPVPTIFLGINLFATQLTAEMDSFNNQYDKDAVIAENAAEAQAALDAAGPGTMIKLAPGVNYGTLYIRPVNPSTRAAAAGNTVEVDFLEAYRKEYLRTVKDLTIIGAPGATVDAIVIDEGYNPDYFAYADVQGFTVDSVTFTDKYDNASFDYSAPLFFNLTYAKFDGITVKNCTLNGDNDKMNMIYFYTEAAGATAFPTYAKNVTITGNTASGIARMAELRGTENVTITGNTVKDTALHAFLLTYLTDLYSGDVVVANNKAEGIRERFLRMTAAENANVTVKNNVVTNYLGSDDNFIKVTKSDNTDITAQVATNNTVVFGRTDMDLAKVIAAAKPGDVIGLSAGTYTLPALGAKEGITILGEGDVKIKPLSHFNFGKNNTFKGLTVANANGKATEYSILSGDVVFEDCTFSGKTYGFHVDNANGGTATFLNCSFKGRNAFASSGSYSFKGCDFKYQFSSYSSTNLYGDATFEDCTWQSEASLYVDGASVTVNGSAVTTQDVLFMSDASTLELWSLRVNSSNNYKGKTVMLGNDIDMSEGYYGQDGKWYPGSGFAGIFDGAGHTISNLTCTRSGAAGFMLDIASTAKIRNVNFVNAKITGTHWVGVIVANEGNEVLGATVENCSVIGSTVICNTANGDDGDKAGGIAGYSVTLTVKNCLVKDTTIKAYRDFGGILGYANAGGHYKTIVTGNTVENVTLIINNDVNYKNYTTDAQHDANPVVGEIVSGSVVENNTVR